MTYFSLLPDRAVLAVSGEDACDFLQGLITKDVKKIASGQAVFAALLSPQGRFLFDFFVTEQDGRFLLETDGERLPELVTRLAMYRLRSKVGFEEVAGMRVAAVWGGSEGQGARGKDQIIYADPRLPELGWRVLFDASSGGGMTEGNYVHHRISLGVPEGAKDLIIDRSLILEYGYDEMNAVDFDKGCYVGQEVTARSKHRATLRKFIHQVRAEGTLPPKGTAILAGEREVGVMAGSQGNAGLALCRVEEVERAAREKTGLTAGGIALAATLPPWCKTAFAGDVLTS